MADSQISAQKITIQKNEGLTQALKRHLASMSNVKYSDGVISAEEWDATIDKLAEMNTARKNANKTSIFEGGTDKSCAGYHTSFIVHENQEIEFTEDEMKTLYDAMGVTITSAEDVSKPEAEDSQGAKDNDKDNKTVDQKAEEAGYRKTWGSGIYYSETEKKHYEYDSETGEFKVIEGLVFAGKDGSRRYETKNQDGTYNSITYNKDGVITEMQARAHNTKYCYTDKEKAAKQLGLRTTWDSKKEIYYSETYRLHFAWDNNKHEFVARPEISQMNPNSYFGTDGKLHERNGNIVKDQPKKEETVQTIPTDEMRDLRNAGQ